MVKIAVSHCVVLVLLLQVSHSNCDSKPEPSRYGLTAKLTITPQERLSPSILDRPVVHSLVKFVSSVIPSIHEMAFAFSWSIDHPAPEQFAHLFPHSPPLQSVLADADILAPILWRLKKRRFFRYFLVDLDAPCPFWAAEGICSSPDSCEVCQCDEDQIPLLWKMKPMEQFVKRNTWTNQTFNPTTTRSYPVTSKWSPVPVNSLISQSPAPRSKAYVDMTLNPPSFTAYRGGPVWDQIYKENCARLRNPLGEVEEGECTEEDMFFRIVSGLHSNIAALSSEYYYKPNNSTTSTYNIDFFREKLGDNSGWISNLYFSFCVLLRTVCEVAPVLQECSCETGDSADDLAARADLFYLLNHTFATCHPNYTQQPLFNRRASDVVEQFENITRILDCVECEKCRVHGKLKMSALQLALRALGRDSYVDSLERNEITALINALAYFTDAVQIVQRFKSRLFWTRITLVTKLFGVLLAIILSTVYIYRWVHSSTKSQCTNAPTSILLPARGGLENARPSTPTKLGGNL